MSTRTSVSQLFDEYNRRYWRGRLPRYRVIRRALPPDLLGRCSDARRTILLQKDLEPERMRLTLLHEMCHIGAVGPGFDHGPRFLRKVRRLVQLGESKLLEEDVERYDGTAVTKYIEAQKAAGHKVPEIPWREDLASELDAFAFSDFWRRRWATMARALAEQYHMTAAQLNRAAPWAERRWRELVADRRQEERARNAFQSGRLHALVGGR